MNNTNKIPVSKVVLSTVYGEAGTRLIEDIKNTKINKNIVNDCKVLIKKLIEGKFSK